MRMQDFNESFQILQAGRALRILRLAKLLSLVRLLRLSRLVRYVNQWEEVYVSLYSIFVWNKSKNIIEKKEQQNYLKKPNDLKSMESKRITDRGSVTWPQIDHNISHVSSKPFTS